MAIALNSVLQGTGQICGGTDSPALRLSPPFQIANVISLVYHSIRLSFAIDLPYKIALSVVADRAGLYDNRAGITEPERHFFFRLLVFIFGALPTVIKALAIHGDRVSCLLVLGFFIPFLGLEFIKWLAPPPTLSRLAEATRVQATRTPAEKKLGVTPFRQLVAYFALTIHINLCLETVNVALMKSIFEAKPLETNRFITRFSSLVAMVVPVSLKVYEWAPENMRSFLVMLTLFVGGIILFLIVVQELIGVWGHWSDIATNFLAITVTTTGTLAHFFVYLRSTSTTLCQLFDGEERHKQSFLEQWTALWTVGCIFLYYGYLYDPSGTYKPAWTDWLP